MKIFYPSVLSAAMAVTLLCSCCKEDPLRGLPLGMIGIEEPVAIEPFKTPFPAKIDTGADVASIDAENIKLVKRGEENIVVFTIR
ncbi:MAG: ATP-dependent zinc protease [Lentisphaeria bacterium]|nr:ATP-dependent zinc protease [Lentisphaeria bacterium]